MPDESIFNPVPHIRVEAELNLDGEEHLKTEKLLLTDSSEVFHIQYIIYDHVILTTGKYDPLYFSTSGDVKIEIPHCAHLQGLGNRKKRETTKGWDLGLSLESFGKYSSEGRTDLSTLPVSISVYL